MLRSHVRICAFWVHHFLQGYRSTSYMWLPYHFVMMSDACGGSWQGQHGESAFCEQSRNCPEDLHRSAAAQAPLDPLQHRQQHGFLSCAGMPSVGLLPEMATATGASILVDQPFASAEGRPDQRALSAALAGERKFAPTWSAWRAHRRHHLEDHLGSQRTSLRTKKCKEESYTAARRRIWHSETCLRRRPSGRSRRVGR